MSKKSKAKRSARQAARQATPEQAAQHAAQQAAQQAARSAAPQPVARETEAVEQFSRKAAKQETRKAREAASRRKKLPNWPLLALALVGMALTGYLTGTAWFETKLAYCGAGSGCDTVQSSRWATLLGAPIALWGFLAYGTLAWIAWRVRQPTQHWQAAWLVALLSLGVSLYLTSISLLVLQASCYYCLASLALIVVIVGLLAVQSRQVPGIAWPVWLAQSAGLAAVVVVLLHLHYSGVFSRSAGPEDPYLRGLAERLQSSGAVFYGASWCPHCQEQKEMFGAAAARLPYVECSPNGPQGAANPVCLANGVTEYPTWTFGTERHTGTLSIEELASRSGYPAQPKSP